MAKSSAWALTKSSWVSDVWHDALFNICALTHPIRVDVTDIIDYNMFCLNRNSLDASFVYLSQKDPQVGFECDLSSFAGCVVGADCGEPDLENPTYLRLLLASHLARYLRLRVENDFGYTSTCGISPNKLLSKLAGTRNKPRNQTALVAFTDQAVLGFMDNHTLRTIPGLGFKTAHLLESHITSQDVNVDSHSFVSTVTARDVRLHPSVNPGFLETCLGGPGAEKGVGARVWHILHGIDPTEVKEASDVPSQISIEDTYKGLETMAQITEQLHKLSRSLLRRMRVDLLVHDDAADDPDARKWMASPKTIRLSIRSWPQDRTNQNMNYSRVSRSAPLPSFVFDIKADVDQLAERLVSEALLPLLRRLQSERGPKWNLQLINICVANMVTGANGAKVGAGRDIAVMFKQQDEVLRPWKVTEESDHEQKEVQSEVQPEVPMEESDFEDEPEWNGGNNPTCPVCDQHIPSFALAAHLRYHELGG